MNRRSLLLSSSAILAAGLLDVRRGSGAAATGTRWSVRTSEGFDAIAFLGPLAGVSLDLQYYADEVSAFLERLPPDFRERAAGLWQSAQSAGVGLLGASLAYLLSSGGNDANMDAVIAAVASPDTRILPAFRESAYWSEAHWAWITMAQPDLVDLFVDMQSADFTGFRKERTGYLADRIAMLGHALKSYDVTTWQSKLTGQAFDPDVEIVLLHFIKPHGVKVQGQTFLQAADYDIRATVRNAAHELLHPPVDRNGAAARVARSVFERDRLVMRIVAEHDPVWGYHTLESLLEEDLVQALDQMISERLGVALPRAERWRQADDGMHVIAAGLYGLLAEDRWIETGGNIADWLNRSALSGRLEPSHFHKVAAMVLERRIDQLWPA